MVVACWKTLAEDRPGRGPVARTLILWLILALVVSAAMADLCDTRCLYVNGVEGNDNASGLTPQEAWRTLARLESEPLQPGDVILLHRGQRWRETLRLTGSGSESAPIRVLPYDTGEPPIISGADVVEDWQEVDDEGLFKKEIGWNAGVILLDGSPLHWVEWGSANETPSLLVPGEFTFDVDLLVAYIHLEPGDSPNLHFLEVSHRRFGFQVDAQSQIELEEITIEGTASHGALIKQSTDIDLRSITIRNTGGYWIATGPYYVGNGVEWSRDSIRVSIIDSTIHDVFDSALSPQQYNTDSVVTEVRIEGCHLYRNGMSGIEIALHPPYEGSTIRDVLIQGNLIERNGKGWSSARPGIGIWSYNHGGASLGANIDGTVIRDNVVTGNFDHGILLSSNSGRVTIDRNTLADNGQDGIRVQDDMPFSSTAVNLTYNAIYGNSGNGFGFSVPHGGAYRLWNNSFYDNGSDADSTYNIQTTLANVPGELLNNVIYGTDSACRYDPNDTASIDATHHNLYYRDAGDLLIQGATTYGVGELGEYKNDTGRGDGSIEADPWFISLASPNLRLQPSSPAQNSGTPLGLEYDRDGSPVPSTDIDLGAYERPADTGAGRVPDQPLWRGLPLTLAKHEDGEITMSWGSSCRTTDNDYGIYEGTLGQFASHNARQCSTGGATDITITPASGNRYYLVVPQGDGFEGSYGTASGGGERPGGQTPCLSQAIASCEP